MLAGIATALIFGGLSLKKLTETRAKKTITVVDGSSAKTNRHRLQEPYADLYTGTQKEEEDCGQSCSKDHAHSHSGKAAPV